MRRSFLIASVGLGALSVALITASLMMYVERPTTVRVAVSGSDTDDYDLMGAAAKLLKHGRRTGVRLKLVTTDGAAAASAALDSGAADLAVVRTDVGMPSAGDTVVLLHKDVGVLVAPGGSDIARIADLGGKTVGMLPQGAGDDELLTTIFAQYDLAPETVKRVPLKPEEIGKAVAGKTVDAVFAVGLASSGLVPQAVRAVAGAGEGPPVFLPVAEADAVAQRIPSYESIEVVRGTFGGTPPRPAEEFDTLGVTYRLVAREDLDGGAVAALTRFLLSERVALAALAPVARRMEAPSTDKGAAIPVHPGTAAYIDDDEETFLDRYSDFIYIGAMVLGVVASGATALFGRLGSAGALRVEDLVTRLLDILKAVRTASAPATLDTCEREVDGIIASALESGGVGALDERRLTTLGMAVDHVRTAIRHRREVLRGSHLEPGSLVDEPAAPALKVVPHPAGSGR